MRHMNSPANNQIMLVKHPIGWRYCTIEKNLNNIYSIHISVSLKVVNLTFLSIWDPYSNLRFSLHSHQVQEFELETWNTKL